MAVTKKDLYVSQIIDDLNNGVTWLKKDDLGFGSIEEKYGANEKQIMMIRKHPSLKDADTNVVIFNVIDDTKDVKQNSEPVSQAGQVSSAEDNRPQPENLSSKATETGETRKTDESTTSRGATEFLAL